MTKKDMATESKYETEYTKHTREIIEKTMSETSLDIEVKYWNNQHHVIISGRHAFCGDESECRAYMQGMLYINRIVKMF